MQEVFQNNHQNQVKNITPFLPEQVALLAEKSGIESKIVAHPNITTGLYV